ncbi:MAG TPA: hypothetical protein VK009_02530 [Chloroflexota bacterium]|nr:hypothetical protein [Chloroflexota bacterium]
MHWPLLACACRYPLLLWLQLRVLRWPGRAVSRSPLARLLAVFEGGLAPEHGAVYWLGVLGSAVPPTQSPSWSLRSACWSHEDRLAADQAQRPSVGPRHHQRAIDGARPVDIHGSQAQAACAYRQRGAARNRRLRGQQPLHHREHIPRRRSTQELG